MKLLNPPHIPPLELPLKLILCILETAQVLKYKFTVPDIEGAGVEVYPLNPPHIPPFPPYPALIIVILSAET